jgi:hypothetical protein
MTIVFVQCRQRDQRASEQEAIQNTLMEFKEDDTLSLKQTPAAIEEWLAYYNKLDSGFRLGRFRATGVDLHFDDLPDANGTPTDNLFRKLFVYSPDSSHYLDLVSYNHLWDNGKLIPGEADQQVVLADARKGIRKQLMYHGPSQLAEAARWTGNRAFVISITSRTEDGMAINAEIILFRLADSTYTNFRLDHHIPADALIGASQNFLDHYFMNRQIDLP